MSTIESSDPLEELSRENDVLERIVERLAEDGLSLSTERPVPRSDILEGLNLLADYQQLHTNRFRSVLEPEARAVAMPGCFEHLDAVGREQAASNERLVRVRSLLEAYREDETGATLRLATELGELTQKTADAIRYEEGYPLSCLLTALPDDAARKVRAGFDRTAAAVVDLEAHVDCYLRREPSASESTLSVHCRQPGCPARGQAESYPAEGGHLGLRAPVGWIAAAGAPRFDGMDLIVVDVDFWCPEHVPRTRKGPTANPIRTTVASTRASTGSRSEDDRGCTCCDPLPEPLA